VAVSGCNSIVCGDGTIERDGACAPATVTTGTAGCGPFTELQGDRCVPQFPPTECDPASTMAMVDPATGVATCIATGGGGGCNAPFACPTPTAANKLTICGQIYDFETMAKFQTSDAQGTQCTAGATSGPCALMINAFDAATMGTRTVGSTYIDDCGRYRMVDIDVNGTSPFISLVFDDAGMAPGPSGQTVSVAVATSKASPVVSDFEGFIVKPSTYGLWAQTGGPSLANGIYVAAYRKHKLAAGVDRNAPQNGVTFAKAGTALPSDDYYFMTGLAQHTLLDPSATATNVNGSALVANRSLSEGFVFDGVGGLGAGCKWEPHGAATVAGLVFIQVYRKADVSGQTCQD
jgi:hypothetical protein